MNTLQDDLWSARILKDDPQAVQTVHEAYYQAGGSPTLPPSSGLNCMLQLPLSIYLPDFGGSQSGSASYFWISFLILATGRRRCGHHQLIPGFF